MTTHFPPLHEVISNHHHNPDDVFYWMEKHYGQILTHSLEVPKCTYFRYDTADWPMSFAELCSLHLDADLRDDIVETICELYSVF